MRGKQRLLAEDATEQWRWLVCSVANAFVLRESRRQIKYRKKKTVVITIIIILIHIQQPNGREQLNATCRAVVDGWGERKGVVVYVQTRQNAKTLTKQALRSLCIFCDVSKNLLISCFLLLRCCMLLLWNYTYTCESRMSEVILWWGNDK